MFLKHLPKPIIEGEVPLSKLQSLKYLEDMNEELKSQKRK